MRQSTVDRYVQAADLSNGDDDQAARESYRKRTREAIGFQVQPALPARVVASLGSSLLIGRHGRKRWAMTIQDMIDAGAVKVIAPGGKGWYMMPKMHAVYLATTAELEAERTLHPSLIANMAGVSQGYASKVIHRLARWGFWDILGSWKGRWGGIVAKARVVVSSIIPTYPRRKVSTVGMIKPEWRIRVDPLAAELIRKPWTMDELQW